MESVAHSSRPAAKPRKKPLRRRAADHSQRVRHAFQIAFLLLNVVLGGELYLWVKQLSTPGATLSAAHPAGVEGWLPIAGLMNLRYWALTGRVPAIHPAAFFLLLAFLAMAWLFRKAFCSWLCPIGTLSEALWRSGRRLFGRSLRPPRWLDVPLRGLKYLLLGFFLWAVAGMSAQTIDGFMRSPYGVIADVRMLNFFRFLGTTGVTVIAVLVLASLLVQDFWCRYLCPYGALLGLVSLPSPLSIQRDGNACIDCAKCVKVCPAALPVDRLQTVRSAECTACLACVAVCPVEGALEMSLPRVVPSRATGHAIPTWALAAGVALLFLGVVGYAKASGHWQSQVPQSVYQRLVPQANEIEHPMP